MRDQDEFDEAVDALQKRLEAEDALHYSKRAIREAMEPKNVGRMANPDGSCEHTGPCGDTMEIYLKVEGNRITSIVFYTDGCGPSIACGSMVTQMAMGKELQEALKIKKEELIEELDGLPPEHLHCAKLAVETLRMAIEDFQRRVRH